MQVQVGLGYGTRDVRLYTSGAIRADMAFGTGFGTHTVAVNGSLVRASCRERKAPDFDIFAHLLSLTKLIVSAHTTVRYCVAGPGWYASSGPTIHTRVDFRNFT